MKFVSNRFSKRLLFNWGLFACFLVSLTGCGESRKAVSAKLVGVTDGDSITVVLNGRETEIRLYGIDAPESRQAHGRESTRALREILTGHDLTIRSMTEDRYGRTVALVFADGKNVGEAMVTGGAAWVYARYCDADFCERWRKSEQKARKAGLGLWRDAAPQPPWDWRTSNRWKQAPADAKASGGVYSANVKSRVFHRHTCKDYRCKNCTLFFTDRGQAVSAGFKPCGLCKP